MEQQNFNIEAEIKWSTFCRWQYSTIGSDNGLAPTRHQAIIWTNDGKFTDEYMRHSTSMS